VFDCTYNTQNSLLLNQHNGDDAPQDSNSSFPASATWELEVQLISDQRFGCG